MQSLYCARHQSVMWYRRVPSPKLSYVQVPSPKIVSPQVVVPCPKVPYARVLSTRVISVIVTDLPTFQHQSKSNSNLSIPVCILGSILVMCAAVLNYPLSRQHN